MKPRSSRTRISNLFIALIFLASLLAIPGITAQTASLEMSSYIVQGIDTEQVAGLVEDLGGTVTSRLHIINSVGATLTPSQVGDLLNESGITSIVPNDLMQVTGKGGNSKGNGGKDGNRSFVPETNYPNIIGATAVWESGVIGDGILNRQRVKTEIAGQHIRFFIGWHEEINPEDDIGALRQLIEGLNPLAFDDSSIGLVDVGRDHCPTLRKTLN